MIQPLNRKSDRGCPRRNDMQPAAKCPALVPSSCLILLEVSLLRRDTASKGLTKSQHMRYAAGRKGRPVRGRWAVALVSDSRSPKPKPAREASKTDHVSFDSLNPSGDR